MEGRKTSTTNMPWPHMQTCRVRASHTLSLCSIRLSDERRAVVAPLVTASSKAFGRFNCQRNELEPLVTVAPVLPPLSALSPLPPHSSTHGDAPRPSSTPAKVDAVICTTIHALNNTIPTSP